MKLLAIDNLNPGMVLAKDLFSLEGRLLLNQGCNLSEKAFRILNIWGITEAWIEFGEAGEAEEPVVVIDNEFLAKATALIEDAFTLPRPETAAETPLREIFLCCAAGDMARFGVAAVVQRYRVTLSPPKAVFRGIGKNGDESIKEILAGEIRLAVLPETVVHLFNAMNGQYSSSAIAEIICRDVGMSAKILRVVNSVFYGFPSRIESLSRAVTIIGQRELQNIAIGISLIGMFRECQVADFDMQGFWRHSVGCGILCKCLGEQLVVADHERLFLAGLLHDIGRLVMLQARPEMVREAILMAGQEKIPLCLAERDLWGFDHGLLGGRLLEHWNFPAGIVDSVLNHHESQHNLVEAGFVHLADVLAHAAAMGNSGVYQVPPINPDVWDMCSLSGNTLRSIVAQAQNIEKTLLNILL
jgi:HD-like signal output (HDOD) protein